MKVKTIEKLLAKKFDEWKESITDPAVKKLVDANSLITGGCIASMLANEKVNDYDVYFTNLETAEAVAKYYVRIFNEPEVSVHVVRSEHEAGSVRTPSTIDASPSANDDNNSQNKALGRRFHDWRWGRGDYEAVFPECFDRDIEKRVKIVVPSNGIKAKGETIKEFLEGANEIDCMDVANEIANEVAAVTYDPVFVSSNAITLSGGIQVIIRFFGPPAEIHENYDFLHCTNYWLSNRATGRKLVLTTEAVTCILTKELRYIGSKYPVCSVIRTRKFIARGWTITAGQYLKMLMQVSQLDLCDLETLEDQLIGVDSAYFCSVISALLEKDKDRVDANYLAQLLDRIF